MANLVSVMNLESLLLRVDFDFLNAMCFRNDHLLRSAVQCGRCGVVRIPHGVAHVGSTTDTSAIKIIN